MASPGSFLVVFDSLHERIEELSFVDHARKLKKYRCCACGNVAIIRSIANCGDVLCTNCYSNYFGKHCPYCGAKVTSVKRNDEFESAVLDMKVTCKFMNNGCEKIISVKDFLQHIELCKFRSNEHFSESYGKNPVAEAFQQTDVENRNKTAINEDPKKGNESVEQMKQEIKNDLKNEIKTLHDVNTQMVLATKDEIRELTKNMQKLEIATENKIEKIGRDLKTSLQNFSEEIQDLKNEMQESRNLNDSSRATLEVTINSLMKKINENVIQNKEGMDEMQTEFMQEIKKSAKTLQDQNKEEMEKLESRQRKRFDELERKLMSTSGRHIEVPEQQLHLDDGEDELPDIFTWKISGIKKKWQGLMGKKHTEIKMEEWFTTQQGFRFKGVLKRCGSYIYIELDFSNDGNPSIPFLHSRKFILLDQMNVIEKQNVELIDRPFFKKNSAEDTVAKYFYYNFFFPARLLEGENNYLKNDEILIQIILEPISILWKQIESQDGVFVWHINDYSRKKKDESDGVRLWLTSKLFKTGHVMGYTAYLQLYLNGDGHEEGEYITVFLCFVSGEQDASLPFPFRCNYTICLLDQSDSSRQENISQTFNREFKEDILAAGTSRFALQSSVESSKYLKNDSILIQTTVKIL